jgi:hypothetical protein
VRTHLIVGVVLGAAVWLTGAWVSLHIGWWALPVLPVFAGGWYLAGRCWHHDDLSLLPPVPGAGDDRAFARWSCQRCGKTWPAAFTPSTQPRRLYVGFDQAKAEQAAARADTLERERRRLAVERAGLRPRETRDGKPGRTAPVPTVSTMPVESHIGRRGHLVSVRAGASGFDEGGPGDRRTRDELPRIRSLRR